MVIEATYEQQVVFWIGPTSGWTWNSKQGAYCSLKPYVTSMCSGLIRDITWSSYKEIVWDYSWVPFRVHPRWRKLRKNPPTHRLGQDELLCFGFMNRVVRDTKDLLSQPSRVLWSESLVGSCGPCFCSKACCQAVSPPCTTSGMSISCKLNHT